MNPLDPFLISGALPGEAALGTAAEALNLLYPAARAAIPFISSGVRRGLSISQIHQALTAGGSNITQRMTASIARQVRGARSSAAYQNSLPGDAFPNPARYTYATNLLSSNYVYHVRATGIDLASGVQVDQFISISSDTLLSNNDLAESLDTIISTSPTDYNMQLTNATVEEVYVDPRVL